MFSLVNCAFIYVCNEMSILLHYSKPTNLNFRAILESPESEKVLKIFSKNILLKLKTLYNYTFHIFFHTLHETKPILSAFQSF